jgi:hypothetical protein
MLCKMCFVMFRPLVRMASNRGAQRDFVEMQWVIC